MKLSKDPFEAAFEEESPPVSPSAPDDLEIQTNNPVPVPVPVPVPIPIPASDSLAFHDVDGDDYDDDDDDPKQKPHNTITNSTIPSSSSIPSTSAFTHSNVSSSAPNKTKDDDDEEDEENVEVELAKFPASGDPDKMAKMQAILSQFTEDQMSRYESFRRAGFQKANMKRQLASISGTQKISVPMTIVVSGIAKMFVGELVETARSVMTERKETGPIRPCHLREAYRRQKLEGKIPKKSVPRLFR